MLRDPLLFFQNTSTKQIFFHVNTSVWQAKEVLWQGSVFNAPHVMLMEHMLGILNTADVISNNSLSLLCSTEDSCCNHWCVLPPCHLDQCFTNLLQVTSSQWVILPLSWCMISWNMMYWMVNLSRGCLTLFTSTHISESPKGHAGCWGLSIVGSHEDLQLL